MRHLLIQSDDGAKGRSFRAELLAYATANALWEPAQGADTVRPIFAMLGCADAEAAPVVANIRLGRKAKMWESKYGTPRETNDVFEFLKSAKYTIASQRHPEGVIVTLYQHDLIRHDVAMVDPNGVEFVLLPDESWLAPEQPDAEAHVKSWLSRQEPGKYNPMPSDEQVRYIGRVCFLWAKQIFARAKGPIPKDARFFAQALTAMLGAGLASFSAEKSYGWNRTFGEHSRLGFTTWGLDRVKMAPGIAVKATHAEIEALLAEQVSQFYQMTEVCRGT